MNTKHYLLISGIVGGIIGSLLTTLLVSPVTAQKDKFGEIECTSLTVIDAEGREVVFLSRNEHGGLVSVYGMGLESEAKLGIGKHGGHVSVEGKKGIVELNVGKDGAHVDVSDSLGIYLGASVSLGVSKIEGLSSGYVELRRREPFEDALAAAFDGTRATVSFAEIRAGRYGGVVKLTGVNKETMLEIVELGFTEHGGHVKVIDNGQDKAIMEIDESGNGTVSTWDKNGTRKDKP